jgi:hypothetical protein
LTNDTTSSVDIALQVTVDWNGNLWPCPRAFIGEGTFITITLTRHLDVNVKELYDLSQHLGRGSIASQWWASLRGDVDRNHNVPLERIVRRHGESTIGAIWKQTCAFLSLSLERVCGKQAQSKPDDGSASSSIAFRWGHDSSRDCSTDFKIVQYVIASKAAIERPRNMGIMLDGGSPNRIKLYNSAIYAKKLCVWGVPQVPVVGLCGV